LIERETATARWMLEPKLRGKKKRETYPGTPGKKAKFGGRKPHTKGSPNGGKGLAKRPCLARKKGRTPKTEVGGRVGENRRDHSAL